MRATHLEVLRADSINVQVLDLHRRRGAAVIDRELLLIEEKIRRDEKKAWSLFDTYKTFEEEASDEAAETVWEASVNALSKER
jgi:hypothetical protein